MGNLNLEVNNLENMLATKEKEKATLLSDLTSFKLIAIWHLFKEFLQSIIRLNVDVMEFVVQGVLVIITKNHIIKMLCLPQIKITKLPAMCFIKVMNLRI